MTRVSVIVPTYNRIGRLKQVIHALEAQDYPRDQFAVIVVSDGSNDGTNDYMSRLKSPLDITFVAQANAGPAAARNNGIAHAKHEYVLFVDDDVVPCPSLISEHMRLHAEQPKLVVLGPMLSPSDFQLSPWVDWEQAMLEKQYAAMSQGKWEASQRQFYTGNTSLARKLLEVAGGFDERFRRAEDVELAYRLGNQGVQFIFNPQAIGYHYATRSLRSWMEIPYAYGQNDVIFAREQQEWILDLVRSEFTQRNALTRAFVKISLDRPTLTKALTAMLSFIARVCYKMRLTRISRAAYSAIFNMRYYQGACDELGGRAKLLKTEPVASKRSR